MPLGRENPQSSLLATARPEELMKLYDNIAENIRTGLATLISECRHEQEHAANESPEHDEWSEKLNNDYVLVRKKKKSDIGLTSLEKNKYAEN